MKDENLVFPGLFAPISCSLGIQAVEAAFASDKNPYEFGSGTSTNPMGRRQIVPHMFFFPLSKLCTPTELRARPKFPRLTDTLCSQIPQIQGIMWTIIPVPAKLGKGRHSVPTLSDIWLDAAPEQFSRSDREFWIIKYTPEPWQGNTEWGWQKAPKNPHLHYPTGMAELGLSV